MGDELGEVRPPVALFTVDDAQRASDAWGMNCGPGAVAAIARMTLDQLLPHLGDFVRKGYTNPTLMWAILRSIGAKFTYRGGDLGRTEWPNYGLARVQWEGPWIRTGVPPRAAYRHTHWVGACRTGERINIFDINCICVGGWVDLGEWSGSVVPWLLLECVPRADGNWHITHTVEVQSIIGNRNA